MPQRTSVTSARSTKLSTTCRRTLASCSCSRSGPRSPWSRFVWLRLRPGAHTATTASTSRSRRPKPRRRSCRGSWPERHARLARVHGDTVRPDPARALQDGAGDDRTKIWGGLKTQQVADLELTLGDVEAPVEAFEAPVAQVVDSSLPAARAAIALPDRIEEDRTGNSERFKAFNCGRHRGIWPEMVLNGGLVILLGACGVARARAEGDMSAAFIVQRRSRPRWSRVVQVALGACAS